MSVPTTAIACSASGVICPITSVLHSKIVDSTGVVKATAKLPSLFQFDSKPPSPVSLQKSISTPKISLLKTPTFTSLVWLRAIHPNNSTPRTSSLIKCLAPIIKKFLVNNTGISANPPATKLLLTPFLLMLKSPPISSKKSPTSPPALCSLTTFTLKASPHTTANIIGSCTLIAKNALGLALSKSSPHSHQLVFAANGPRSATSAPHFMIMLNGPTVTATHVISAVLINVCGNDISAKSHSSATTPRKSSTLNPTKNQLYSAINISRPSTPSQTTPSIPKVCYNNTWKRGRVVEGARLEIVWAEMSRRFESSRFRQKIKIASSLAHFYFQGSTEDKEKRDEY